LELTVHGFGGDQNQPYTVGVYRVTQPWEEGNGAEAYREIVPGTTDTDHASGIAWEPGAGSQNHPQPTFDPKPIAEVKIDPKTIKTGSVVTWDIMPLVQQWLQDPRSNYGVMLRDVTTGGAFRQLSFGTHEADSVHFPDGVKGPRLVIQSKQPMSAATITYSDINAALRNIPDQYSYNTRYNKAVVKWFQLVGGDPANNSVTVKCRFRYQRFESLGPFGMKKVADKACNLSLNVKVGIDAERLVVLTSNCQKSDEEGWGIDLAIKALPIATGAVCYIVGGSDAAEVGIQKATTICNEILKVYPDDRVGDVVGTATAAIARALGSLAPIVRVKSARVSQAGDIAIEAVQPG
jgi:hypothetical protein